VSLKERGRRFRVRDVRTEAEVGVVAQVEGNWQPRKLRSCRRWKRKYLSPFRYSKIPLNGKPINIIIISFSPKD
jgi:hypothetical protein